MKQHTFIVLGNPRGGTSMMSKALHESGCPMSLKPLRPDQIHFEDPDFRALGGEKHNGLTSANPLDYMSLIKERNKHWVDEGNSYHWGWKWHPSVWVIDELIELEVVRNPKIICVFRDLVAVRTAIEGRHEATWPGEFEVFLRQQEEMLYLAKKYGRDVMSVSYERAQIDPFILWLDFKNFTGLNPDKHQFESWVTDQDVRRRRDRMVSVRG